MDHRRPARAPVHRTARQASTQLAPVWQGNNAAAVRRTQDVRPPAKPQAPVAAQPVPVRQHAQTRHVQPVAAAASKPQPVLAPQLPVQQQMPAPQPTPIAQPEPPVAHHTAEAHTPALRPETPPAKDAPTVSIKITVPDSEIFQNALAWRPTPKQVIIFIGLVFLFTVGYQMGRHDGANQLPKAAYMTNAQKTEA